MFRCGDAGGLTLRNHSWPQSSLVLLYRLCTDDLQRALLSPPPWDWLS